MGGLVLRQLDQPASHSPYGDVAGGKGCPPAANGLAEQDSVGTARQGNLFEPFCFSRARLAIGM